MGILQIIRGYQNSGTRKFYGTVPDSQIRDASYDPKPVTKDKDYFSIRLCEMFLKNKANFISGFVPMAITLNIFDYAGAKRSIPVLVGNQMLREIEQYVKNQDIEFKNVPIIGPVPCTGNDVSLFVGLYRVAVNNLAKSLFGVVQRLIGAFDIADLSSYLNIAERIGDGLAGLIGLPEVEMRFGTMDTFTMSGSTMRDRYLLFINSAETDIDQDKIWVKNGRLYEGDSIDSNAPYTGQDYCLVRIERLESRPDIDKLPFHRLYIDSKGKIWEGNLPEAFRLFHTLVRSLSCSPDLTAEDRSALIETYLVNFEQEKENYATFTGRLKKGSGPFRKGSKLRAGEGNNLSALETVQLTADLAENIDGLPNRKEAVEAVQRRLNQLTRHWKDIPYLIQRNEPSDLDANELIEQFKAVKTSQQGTATAPELLADAISISAFHNIRPV